MRHIRCLFEGPSNCNSKFQHRKFSKKIFIFFQSLYRSSRVESAHIDTSRAFTLEWKAVLCTTNVQYLEILLSKLSAPLTLPLSPAYGGEGWGEGAKFGCGYAALWEES